MQGQKSRWWLPLFCSLFLNVALGSHIAMRAVPAESQGLPPQWPQWLLARLAERLPPSDALVLREAYVAREARIVAAEIAAEFADIRAEEIVGRHDFELDALRVVIQRMGEQRMRMGELFFGVVVETMQHISPEGQKLVRDEFRRRFTSR
jgi:hypothetical protein